MKHILTNTILLIFLTFNIGCKSQTNKQTETLKITNLNDSFTKHDHLVMDWGYSSIIEYKGKKILFDLGNNAEVLEANIRKLNINIKDIDFAVLSHRHSDHMGGMDFLLKENPTIKIYAPTENFGIYGASLPSSFYKKDPNAPKHRQYYNGHPEEIMHFGKAWSKANIKLITKNTEIIPGFHLIFLVSDFKGTLELSEISLAIDSPSGQNIIIGCGHTGLENIIKESQKINPKTNLITGGFHLLQKEDSELNQLITKLDKTYHVKYAAPSHCSGERAMTFFEKTFNNRYIYAGLGETITLKL